MISHSLCWGARTDFPLGYLVRDAGGDEEGSLVRVGKCFWLRLASLDIACKDGIGGSIKLSVESGGAIVVLGAGAAGKDPHGGYQHESESGTEHTTSIGA